MMRRLRGEHRLKLFRPPSRAVEHTQDFDGVVAHAVRNDVWGAGYYQLAGAGDAAGPAQGGLGREEVDASRDALHNLRGGLRIVAGDVVGFFVEISERAPKPSYPHCASTSSSQPRPQLRWRSRPRRLP